MDSRITQLSVYRRLVRTRRALRDWRTEAARSALYAQGCREGDEPDLMVLADTHALAAILADESAVATADLATCAGRAHAALASDLEALACSVRDSHHAMRDALLSADPPEQRRKD